MGRHSAPTVLTRAAKRAGVVTSAVAAAASLSMVGTGAAHAADTIPGATQAEGAYGDLLKAATSAAAKAVAQGEKGVTQIVGTYNDIPLLADVITVTTEDGVTVPLLGNLRLATAADEYQTDAMATYKGIAGEYEGGGTWSWGDNGGTGGAPYLYVNTLTDPLGIVKGGSAFIGTPVLNVGNGGFNIGDNFSQTWVQSNGGILNGDAGFHLPSFSLDNDGLELAGPRVYTGSKVGDFGAIDLGLDPGSIIITKDGVKLHGPTITGEDWGSSNAALTANGYGTLTGHLTTFDAEFGKTNSITLPKVGLGAESAALPTIGKVNVGAGGSGGTYSASGVDGIDGYVTGGNSTTTKTSQENNDDEKDKDKVTSTTDTTTTVNNQFTVSGEASSKSDPVVSGVHEETTHVVVETTDSGAGADTRIDSDTTKTTTTTISTDEDRSGTTTTPQDDK